MGQEVSNYARFYLLLDRLPGTGDREETKRSLVSQHTGGRTDSLRSMTRAEYDACCATLERITGDRDRQRRLRSETLRLMQKMGVDTTDWTRVNSLCMDRRIAGKPFGRLTNEELESLSRKLRGIRRKGGFRSRKEEPGHGADTVRVIPIGGITAEC